MLTDRYTTTDFLLKVYTLTASTVVDQYFSIGFSSDLSYTWPSFSYTEYTVSYELLVSGSLSDATASYSWLSLINTDTGF